MQKTILGLKLLILSFITHLGKKELFITCTDNTATKGGRKG